MQEIGICVKTKLPVIIVGFVSPNTFTFDLDGSVRDDALFVLHVVRTDYFAFGSRSVSCYITIDNKNYMREPGTICEEVLMAMVSKNSTVLSYFLPIFYNDANDVFINSQGEAVDVQVDAFSSVSI